MKKSMALVLISCLVLTGCSSSKKETSTASEPVLTSNQTLKCGQVKKINGNEVSIAWATEVSSSDMSSMRGNRPSSTDSQNNNQSSEQQPSGQHSGGEQPAGEQPAGNPPSGEQPSTGGAQGGGMEGGAPPEMNESSDSGKTNSNRGNRQNSGSSNSGTNNKNSRKQNRTMYKLTGEEATITIPVGTKVTTSLGTTTTFSRIADGDTLKLVMEKDDSGNEVVVGVWIAA